MAEIKISELPAATSANGSMELETNDSGTSKKVTVTQVATFVNEQTATNVNITGGTIDCGTIT